MENILEKIKNLNNKQKVLVLIVGFVIVLVVFFFLYKTFYAEETEYIITNSNEENQIDENEDNEVKESKIGIAENKKTITVHVIGEVNSPRRSHIRRRSTNNRRNKCSRRKNRRSRFIKGKFSLCNRRRSTNLCAKYNRNSTNIRKK